MKRLMTLLIVPFLTLTAPACSGGNGGRGGAGGGGGGGAGGDSVVCQGTNVVANEANDYQFSSTLTFPPIGVQPKSELSFDWGSVTKSFIGHPLDAKKDLNMISILMWDLDLPTLQTKLNADSLAQRNLTVVPLTITTDGSNTSAKLFTFTLNGGAVDSATIISYFDADAYPPDTHTYTLIAQHGTVVGSEAKMIQSFRLDPNSTITSVKMTDESTQLTYDAKLTTLTPTGIPANQKSITLDWSQMKTNALGNEFIISNITRVMVAHYTQTPAELEDKFLDIELIATDLYQTKIDTGSTVDFSTLKTESEKSFSGIDNTGTWIVALQCGGCRNPAPWYLSILKPCS